MLKSVLLGILLYLLRNEVLSWKSIPETRSISCRSWLRAKPSMKVEEDTSLQYPSITDISLPEVVQILKQFNFRPCQLNKILISNQYDASEILKKSIFLIKTLTSFSGSPSSSSDIIPLIRSNAVGIRPEVLLLPMDDFEERITFFQKFLHCSKSDIKKLLTKRRLWTMPRSKYLQYTQFLQNEYKFSISEILKLLLQSEFFIFDDDLMTEIEARKKIFQDILLIYPTFDETKHSNSIEIKKKIEVFHKICIRNPKLLILSPFQMLSNILAIVEGIGITNAQELHRLIRISGFVLNYEDSRILFDRSSAVMNLLLGSNYMQASDGGKDISFASSIKTLLMEINQNKILFSDREKGLGRSSSTDIGFVRRKLVEHEHISLHPILEENLQDIYLKADHPISDLSFPSFRLQILLKYFQVADNLCLTRNEAMKVALRSNIILNTWEANYEKLGLIAMTLGLTANETARILSAEPLVMNSNFLEKTLPKLLLLAQAAEVYIRHSNMSVDASCLGTTIDDFVHCYRHQSIRSLVRDCVLANPRILTVSLQRYEDRVRFFQNASPPIRWKKLTNLIYLNKMKPSDEDSKNFPS